MQDDRRAEISNMRTTSKHTRSLSPRFVGQGFSPRGSSQSRPKLAPRTLVVILNMTLLAVAVRRKGRSPHGMTSPAGHISSLGYSVIRLLVINRSPRLRKDFRMASFALILYSLIVLAMRKRDIAILGDEYDRLRRHAGGKLFGDDLIIVGRGRWWGRGCFRFRRLGARQ